jgi:hypothetical protein
MVEIERPSIPRGHPDRYIACQDALHGAFRELVDSSVLAGWSEQEALSALIDLADHRILAMEANSQSDILIALLRRMT